MGYYSPGPFQLAPKPRPRVNLFPDMNQLTQIGIIGCGNISNAYFSTGAKFPFFDIAACADLNLDAAKSKAEQWQIPKACTVDELLADDSIDFIINLTIPQAHGPVMLRCLEAGKHVYTEKTVHRYAR